MGEMKKVKNKVDRDQSKGKQVVVMPANELQNNCMEQQTGRYRTTLPIGVPMVGRPVTQGAPVARRPR